MAFDDELTVLYADAEAVVGATSLNDADGGGLGGYGLVAGDELHIVSEHAQGLIDDGGGLARQLIGDGVLAVVPHDIGCGGTAAQ